MTLPQDWLPKDWLFEAIKLLAQLGGALFVARLAVKWALSRFKKEKSWEKRLQAYTDVIFAITEMRTVVTAWLEDYEDGSSASEKHKEQMSRRYTNSRLKLEELRAMASLLLPDVTSSTINHLFSELEDIPIEGHLDDIYGQHRKALTTASEKILEQGRKSLGVHLLT